MTTQAQLRDALDRATGRLSIDVDAAETRVRALGHARQRRHRRLFAVAATAVVAATTVMAVVLAPRLTAPSRSPAPATASSLVTGAVDGGTYQLRGFAGPTVVRLQPGWTATLATAGDVRLSRRDNPDARLGLLVRPRVFEPGASNVVTNAPADLVGWLKGHPDLVLSASSPIRSDGYLGTNLELRVRPQVRTTGATCSGECLPLFQLASGPVVVPANAILRVVDINEAGHALLIYSWAGPTNYTAWARLADPVIATLRLR